MEKTEGSSTMARTRGLRRVVVIPGAPVLVPALGRGLEAELGSLRALISATLRSGAVGVDIDGGEGVVVAVAGARMAVYEGDAGCSLEPFGVPVSVGGPVPVPFSPVLAVAWALLGAAGVPVRRSIVLGPDGDAPAGAYADAATLVVVAEGGAGLGPDAPLRDVPGAAGLEDRLARIVSAPAALAATDTAAVLPAESTARDLGLRSLASWRLLVRLAASGAWRGVTGHAAAPFGVGMHVGSWERT